MTRAGRASGAYGLRLSGLSSDLLVPAAADWPDVAVSRVSGPVPPTPLRLDGQVAEVGWGTHARVRARRDPGAVEIHTHRSAGDDELVHPGLAPAAVIFSYWHGRLALHAGGFVAGGRAIGVLGPKEHGKSSLMAALALRGAGIVADDVLVVTAAGSVLAGPRCIDLRPATAERIDAPGRMSDARLTTRKRFTVDPIDVEVALGGWVALSWGDAIAVEPLAAKERFALLVENLAWSRLAFDAGAVLAAAALPAWRLTRPQRWDAEEAAIATLLDVLER